jgi:hypothetical protein
MDFSQLNDDSDKMEYKSGNFFTDNDAHKDKKKTRLDMERIKMETPK